MGVVFEMEEVIDIMKYGVECSIQFTDAETPVVKTLAAHEMQQFRILIEKFDMAYTLAQYTLHATTYTACPEEGTYDCKFLSKIDWYKVLTHTLFSRRVEHYVHSILIDNNLGKFAPQMRRIRRETRNILKGKITEKERKNTNWRRETLVEGMEAVLKEKEIPGLSALVTGQQQWRREGKFDKETLPGDQEP
ncbi:hypothetical protein HDE_12900 [Halotydeus destructor]|nr:hypothetical protein HDE_12900 [Halotydeus destructor]